MLQSLTIGIPSLVDEDFEKLGQHCLATLCQHHVSKYCSFLTSSGFISKPAADLGCAEVIFSLSFREYLILKIMHSFWNSMNGFPFQVYDVTSYMDEHPGGDDVFLTASGMSINICRQ